MKANFIFILLIFSSVFAFGQTVTFKGIDKSHKQSRFVVSKFSKTFDFEYEPILTTIGKAVYQNDSVFTINIDLEEASSVQLQAQVLDSPRPYLQVAWIEPGDDLFVVLDEKNIERPMSFIGKDALTYTIYQEYDQLEKEIQASEPKGFDELDKAYEALQNRFFSI
jgi:hypothetical protein